MIRACLLVIAGGFVAQHSRVPVSWDLCKLGLVASILLLAHSRTRTPGFFLLGLLLFMQAGIAIIDSRLDSRFAGDSLLTRVRIVDFPEVRGNSLLMLVSPVDDERLPPVSRVSWYDAPLPPSIGDTWELELRLRRPRGSSNPAVFDFESWLFRQRIHALGYVVAGKRNRLLESGSSMSVDGTRSRFVRHALGASESRDAAAVLAAVGVGARHLVSREQWERYSITGTSHLMAISGLHIGLAATSAFLLLVGVLGALRVSSNPHLLALLCSVAVAAGYAALSGFGVPAQRATLMLFAVALASVRRRQVDPPAVLAAAALVVYLVDPVATMTPGFHLSFVAVVVLLWLARRRAAPARTGISRCNGLNAIRQLITMQSFLLLGLMPLTVLIFQRVAFLAMLANIVAVPVFSFVTVPLTLAGLALGPVSEVAATSMLRLAAVGISWIEAFINEIAELPFADVTVAAVGGIIWPVVLVPALWVLLPRGWPGRWLALLAAATIVVQVPKPPPRGCVDAHVLDVGQGLAVVLQTTRHFLVFDTGVSFRGGGSVAKQVILPFLRSRGTSRIHWLVVSHADIDHSGGVATLSDNIEIGTIIAGEPWPDVTGCHAGQAWQADGLRFRILHPELPLAYTGNNASCVLLVTAGRHGILLTGDIEARAERMIVRQHALRDIDVVLVPHHGSLTSSSMPFVDAISPILAVVSSGYANRWGFPKETVVERWQSVGAEVVNTALAGAVSLRLCEQDGVVALRKDRHARRRFWRESSK